MQWWCAAQGIPWSWSWRPYPGVWALLALIVLAYATATRGAADRAHRVRFGAGVALLWIALDWPVGALGAGYLASVHMVQFLLIAMIAPVLLLTGIPRATLVRLLGSRAGPALRFATRPGIALLLFHVVVAVTHWPSVVDTLMATQAGSFLLDMAWLAGGIAFWWPVLLALPERRFPWIAKIGYLILTTVGMTLPYIFLTFADLPFYATYELAPPVAGITARADQQLAGLIMRIGGGAVLWIAAGTLFFLWYREENPPARATTA